jgi:hypothetical protein
LLQFWLTPADNIRLQISNKVTEIPPMQVARFINTTLSIRLDLSKMLDWPWAETKPRPGQAILHRIVTIYQKGDD